MESMESMDTTVRPSTARRNGTRRGRPNKVVPCALERHESRPISSSTRRRSTANAAPAHQAPNSYPRACMTWHIYPWSTSVDSRKASTIVQWKAWEVSVQHTESLDPRIGTVYALTSPQVLLRGHGATGRQDRPQPRCALSRAPHNGSFATTDTV